MHIQYKENIKLILNIFFFKYTQPNVVQFIKDRLVISRWIKEDGKVQEV